ncbi:MAG: ATP-grasp domain-containing protein [Acidocella sp.]|nr:ATP-grasp domain-containing protein [Acidocella sp.]
MAKAGCRVAVLCPPGHPVRTVAGIALFGHQWRTPLGGLMGAIAGSSADLIIPCDDRAVGYLHRLHASAPEATRRLIERSIGVQTSYSIVASRERLLSRARELGVQTAMGAEVSDERMLDTWMDEHQGPWVLKQSGSWGGMGVVIARDKREARRAFHKLRARSGYFGALKRFFANHDPFWLADLAADTGHEVSIQNFISGRRADLAAFACDGVVRATTMAQTITSDGPTGPSTLVQMIDDEAAREAARKLARDLGLSGFFGLDFMIDEGTGAACLIEMNPRLTPLSNIRGDALGDPIGAALRACGLDAGAAARPAAIGDLVVYFRNDTAPDVDQEATSDVVFDFPFEMKALMAERRLVSWPERHWLARMAAACQALSLRMGRAPRVVK